MDDKINQNHPPAGKCRCGADLTPAHLNECMTSQVRVDGINEMMFKALNEISAVVDCPFYGNWDPVINAVKEFKKIALSGAEDAPVQKDRPYLTVIEAIAEGLGLPKSASNIEILKSVKKWGVTFNERTAQIEGLKEASMTRSEEFGKAVAEFTAIGTALRLDRMWTVEDAVTEIKRLQEFEAATKRLIKAKVAIPKWTTAIEAATKRLDDLEAATKRLENDVAFLRSGSNR